ncbi:TVP38/TMEM64 family protein [Alicyclobacillus dauci]|uniref:TVP38/TMEM64 family membrane protein n=1 Tax=Alicyclobacillus dauci TaxID=1475485 RepID=A0ABY6Z7M5_9BACL|nr:VTT domain-containing protein [Alicyclobacillus dauci]WAH38822.1 VTT domain-containing protein [Alicyclobacillus dauci]
MDTNKRTNEPFGKPQSSRHPHPHEPARRQTRRISIITVVTLAVFICLIILFFRIDRSNEATHLIQSTGVLGILVSILLMALLSMLPVPSEFLMIVIMRVFGPLWGAVLSFVGTMLAAVGTFLLARHFGQRLLRAFVSEKRVEQISEWIGRRGVVGLILVRVIPFPFIVVNYTAGVIRSVTTRDFIWTSAVGGIPYYVGAALVYLGVSKRYIMWLVIGGLVLGIIWIAGYIFNRYVPILKRWSH